MTCVCKYTSYDGRARINRQDTIGIVDEQTPLSIEASVSTILVGIAAHHDTNVKVWEARLNKMSLVCYNCLQWVVQIGILHTDFSAPENAPDDVTILNKDWMIRNAKPAFP